MCSTLGLFLGQQRDSVLKFSRVISRHFDFTFLQNSLFLNYQQLFFSIFLFMFWYYISFFSFYFHFTKVYWGKRISNCLAGSHFYAELTSTFYLKKVYIRILHKHIYDSKHARNNLTWLNTVKFIFCFLVLHIFIWYDIFVF